MWTTDSGACCLGLLPKVFTYLPEEMGEPRGPESADILVEPVDKYFVLSHLTCNPH